jgi:hypothetical protein
MLRLKRKKFRAQSFEECFRVATKKLSAQIDNISSLTISVIVIQVQLGVDLKGGSLLIPEWGEVPMVLSADILGMDMASDGLILGLPSIKNSLKKYDKYPMGH